MKILSVHLENFASYKELAFNFQDQGLTLIHGPTGSGKSTLMDAIPWILFGVTAKNGKADEVLSWRGGATRAKISLKINNTSYVVVDRVRGKTNDLSYYLDNVGPQRGKDIPDTQKLINQLLGFDSDLYLAGAYYHELSQTAQFFTTTAKNRRTITEQLVDLSLPKNLTEKTSAKLKTLRKEEGEQQSFLDGQKRSLEFAINHENKFAIQIKERDVERLKKLQIVKAKSLTFEEDRTKELTEINKNIADCYIVDDSKLKEETDEVTRLLSHERENCESCGAPKRTAKHLELSSLLEEFKAAATTNEENKRTLAHLKKNKFRVEASTNVYAAQVLELEQDLPGYDSALANLQQHRQGIETSVADTEATLAALRLEQSDLETLQGVVSDFRGLLIANTISSIQEKANRLLTDHFDAELRISLQVEDADKLEVLITKDGNEASFTQLSKGQRQILKLCFAVAVMKAIQQYHSVNLEQIFIDEALEGLDESMKLKSLGLLQKLALDYNSLLIVDHSENIKAMAVNKYKVELINGASTIEQD